MRRRLVIAAALAAVAIGCGDNNNSPTSPTTSTTPTPTPAATTATISGTVRNQAGTALAGAIVVVLDGVNINTAALTASNGSYTLRGLTPGGMTVAARFPDYEEVKAGINVTSASTQNFTLRT